MHLIDSPAARPRLISSRSVNDNDNRNCDHSAAGIGRRQPDDTNRVWIVDGDLPTARLIDRCDSPPSHRSQTSALSNSDNRTITNLLDEKPILTERDATTP
jgi:hypothetical protein